MSYTMTFKDVTTQWLTVHADKRTIADDRRYTAYFLPQLGRQVMAQIDREEVRRLIEQRKALASASTANRYLAFLRAVWNFALERGWVPGPLAIKAYRVAKGRVRYLSEDELQRLMAALPAHLVPIVRLAILTGLRAGNLINLRWSQIDLKRGTVRIASREFKTNRDLVIPLNAEALQLLRDEAGRPMRHATHVFTYRQDRIRSANNTGWQSALRRAGITDFRFHDLRHSFASYHVMAGTPLAVLKELGGWATIDMVQRYAHLSPDSVRRWVENSTPQ